MSDVNESPESYWWPVRVNWDMDGVICQFQEALVSMLNEELGTGFTVDDLTRYYVQSNDVFRDLIDKERMWEIAASVEYDRIAPYRDVLGVLNRTAALGFPSSIVSSLTMFPRNTTACQKHAWVERHVRSKVCLVLTSEKHWCCRRPEDVLIDDSPSNVKDWPGRALLLERPWNREEREPWMRSCSPSDLESTLLEMLSETADLWKGSPQRTARRT